MLRFAIEHDDVPKIKELIAKFPALLDHTDAKGETPLHWAAGVRKISSVGCLVDLGADPKKKNSAGQIPADYACDEFRMGVLTDICQMVHDRLNAGPLK